MTIVAYGYGLNAGLVDVQGTIFVDQVTAVLDDQMLTAVLDDNQLSAELCVSVPGPLVIPDYTFTPVENGLSAGFNTNWSPQGDFQPRTVLGETLTEFYSLSSQSTFIVEFGGGGVQPNGATTLRVVISGAPEPFYLVPWSAANGDYRFSTADISPFTQAVSLRLYLRSIAQAAGNLVVQITDAS